MVGGGLIDVPTQPAFAAAAALILCAGGGRLIGGGPRQAPAPWLGRPIPWIGFGLTLVAIALAAISASGREDCGVEDPAWTETVAVFAVVAALAAAAIGVVLLVGRRWIAALACLLIGPFCVLILLLVGACLS
jgi:hypothetical protein